MNIKKDLFPYINELILHRDETESCLSSLGDCKSSLSIFVPWSLLTTITIHEGNIINAAQLKSIIQLADHVHTLALTDETGILTRDILQNKDNVATILNQTVIIIFFFF